MTNTMNHVLRPAAWRHQDFQQAIGSGQRQLALEMFGRQQQQEREERRNRRKKEKDRKKENFTDPEISEEEYGF